MTVKELYAECKKIMAEGYGDYNVVLSKDDEGNGYRDLFFPFMTNREMVKTCVGFSCNPHAVSDVEHSVILG